MSASGEERPGDRHGVCMLVAFTSLGTFCTRFKKQVGMTPTEFRDRALRAGPAPHPGLPPPVLGRRLPPAVSNIREAPFRCRFLA